jgi:hypothetical protein
MHKEADIHVVTLREKVIIAPRSVLGMLWLQLHFEDEEWEVLSQGSFLLSRACATAMVMDAQEAELNVTFD